MDLITVFGKFIIGTIYHLLSMNTGRYIKERVKGQLCFAIISYGACRFVARILRLHRPCHTIHPDTAAFPQRTLGNSGSLNRSRCSVIIMLISDVYHCSNTLI